jgi:hypothetical protein
VKSRTLVSVIVAALFIGFGPVPVPDAAAQQGKILYYRNPMAISFGTFIE